MDDSSSRSLSADTLRRKPLRERYPIPSRLNALIVIAQLVLLALAFWLLGRRESWWSLLALAIYFGVVMNAVYSTVHEAYHGMLFRNRRLNDFVGCLLALFFPASFTLLRQGHLGHHRKNRSDDEAFDLYFDRDQIWWKYIAWYGILTGLYWLLVVSTNLILLLLPWLFSPKLWRWDRTAEVFLEHFSPESFSRMRLEAFCVCLAQVGLFFLSGASLMEYALMYFGFGLMWSSLQYVHHYQAERDVLDGAKNLHLFEPLDSFWMHHNLHQAHHQAPTIPWCYLPDLAAAKSVQTTQLLKAYIQMWRGPRYAEQRVHNRFEGEVSRS